MTGILTARQTLSRVFHQLGHGDKSGVGKSQNLHAGIGAGDAYGFEARFFDQLSLVGVADPYGGD